MNVKNFNIIRLSRTEGFTATIFHKSLARYRTVDNIIKNFGRIENGNIKLCDEEKVSREIEECEKLGAKVITYMDSEYPPYLRSTGIFPLALTCLGNISLLDNNRKLAIVGSRSCSVNSFNFTKKIAREISNYGYIIVSGLARGIDSASHIGSLENGTIAILGSGINNIYPRENEYLYYEILDKNGLIVSEFSLNTKPRPENFPIRNRTIAGISKGVLIISAGMMSGSLHTANQAAKYGREILVFPGNPYDNNYIGSNKLLQQGATMVTSVTDIIESLESFILPRDADLNDSSQEFGEKFEFHDTNYSSEHLSGAEENKQMNFEDDSKKLTPEELILSKLDHCPVDVGELIDQINLEIGEINSIIMKLNLEGKIIIENGKICIRGIY
ncbi:MAG: DNA-processing protein DprA [Rickettsiales bacterium]|jgi:DNA processing protein|nr:DNA-processing protein DprA [Rickettsiales bacterium]